MPFLDAEKPRSFLQRPVVGGLLVVIHPLCRFPRTPEVVADKAAVTLNAVPLARKGQQTVADGEIQLGLALVDKTESEQAGNAAEQRTADENQDKRYDPASVVQVGLVRPEQDQAQGQRGTETQDGGNDGMNQAFHALAVIGGATLGNPSVAEPDPCARENGEAPGIGWRQVQKTGSGGGDDGEHGNNEERGERHQNRGDTEGDAEDHTAEITEVGKTDGGAGYGARHKRSALRRRSESRDANDERRRSGQDPKEVPQHQQPRLVAPEDGPQAETADAARRRGGMLARAFHPCTAQNAEGVRGLVHLNMHSERRDRLS